MTPRLPAAIGDADLIARAGLLVCAVSRPAPRHTTTRVERAGAAAPHVSQASRDITKVHEQGDRGRGNIVPTRADIEQVQDFAARPDPCFGEDMFKREPIDPESSSPPFELGGKLGPLTFERARPAAREPIGAPSRSMRELPHLRPQFTDDRRPQS